MEAMTKLATSANFKFDVKKHAERGGGKSSTVPDMVPSIKEILENNTIRSSVPVFHSHYPGDADFPDVNRMDLVEIDEMKGVVDQQVKELQNKRKEHYGRKKALQEKLDDEKFQERFKKIKEEAPPTPAKD